MSNTSVGNLGEELAIGYLKKLGYKILERNFRIRGGEVDIIALDKDTVVFVEVKARYSNEFGTPLESITPWKIKFLIKTANFYLLKKKWQEKPYRFDAIGIDYSNSRDNPEIELVLNITF